MKLKNLDEIVYDLDKEDVLIIKKSVSKRFHKLMKKLESNANDTLDVLLDAFNE